MSDMLYIYSGRSRALQPIIKFKPLVNSCGWDFYCSCAPTTPGVLVSDLLSGDGEHMESADFFVKTGHVLVNP